MQIVEKNSPNKRREPRAGNNRPAETQLADKLAESSESNIKDVATAAPLSTSREAKISFFITRAQKAQLRERGYSNEQIAHMKPAEAHKILGLDLSDSAANC